MKKFRAFFDFIFVLLIIFIHSALVAMEPEKTQAAVDGEFYKKIVFDDEKKLYSSKGIADLYDAVKGGKDVGIDFDVNFNAIDEEGNGLFRSILIADISVEQKLFVLETLLETFVQEQQLNLFSNNEKNHSMFSTLFDYYLNSDKKDKKQVNTLFKGFFKFFQENKVLEEFRWQFLVLLWNDIVHKNLQYSDEKRKNKTMRDLFIFATQEVLLNKKPKFHSSLLEDSFIVLILRDVVLMVLRNEEIDILDYFIKDLGVNFDDTVKMDGFEGPIIIYIVLGLRHLLLANIIDHNTHILMVQRFNKIAKKNRLKMKDIEEEVALCIQIDLKNLNSEELKERYTQDELQEALQVYLTYDLNLFVKHEYYGKELPTFLIALEKISFGKYKDNIAKITLLLNYLKGVKCEINLEEVYKKLFSELKITIIKDLLVAKPGSKDCQKILKEVYNQKLLNEQMELLNTIEEARKKGEFHQTIFKLIQKNNKREDLQICVLDSVTKEDCTHYKGKNFMTLLLDQTSINYVSKCSYVGFIVKKMKKNILMNLLNNDTTEDSPLVSLINLDPFKYPIVYDYIINNTTSFESLKCLKGDKIKQSCLIDFLRFIQTYYPKKYNDALKFIPKECNKQELLATKNTKNKIHKN